jgi:methyl-accepting chemotaxis protein
MGLIDAATAPLRYVINGVVEHGTEATEPLRDLEQIQAHVLHAVEAIKDATEQIEAHVEVIETLASSLAPLTAAVVKLTQQLESFPALTDSVGELNERLAVIADVLEPLAHAEQDVRKVGSIFSRHRSAPPPPE